jgi:hypothetical protein
MNGMNGMDGMGDPRSIPFIPSIPLPFDPPIRPVPPFHALSSDSCNISTIPVSAMRVLTLSRYYDGHF